MATQEFTALRLNHIKSVIAVMSGKGGIGKSLVAAMLAIASDLTGLGDL